MEPIKRNTPGDGNPAVNLGVWGNREQMNNMKNNFIIGIQCFVKLETLKLVVEKLEQCYNSENYTLMLFVDSSNNLLYKKRPDWITKNKEVKDYIDSYKSDKFKSIIKYYEKQNLGPYVGCKKTVDLCFEHSDYVIFMEDDSVVSKDYLLFHECLFNQFMLFDENIFAGSASSVVVENTDKLYEVEKVHWINSTEFSMTKKMWSQFGHLRAKICGDVELGKAVKQNNKYTLMPRKTPRMCKIGRGHPDSFSVLQNAVKLSLEPNNVFLPMDKIEIDKHNYVLGLV